jgi:hypothetical protein
MKMRRREFLATSLALNVAAAAIALADQTDTTPARGRGAARGGTDANTGAAGGRGTIPKRTAKTTKMFKSPGMYPNALAAMTDAPGGLWIGQQKANPSNARSYGVPEDPTGPDEAAWLVDWNGKLLKTVMSHSRNTSGMAYGNGYVWIGANQEPYGIFQVDMNSNEIAHRQIPLALGGNGGGCHGVKWHDGKLWIAALRLGGILRVDPATWTPEVLIRVSSEDKPRLHDVAFDDEGNIWVVTGINSNSYATGQAGLSKYDGKTGNLVMTVDFEKGSSDPHGLVWHDGHLVSCDAGLHPGWNWQKGDQSPTSGYIFSIEIV